MLAVHKIHSQNWKLRAERNIQIARRRRSWRNQRRWTWRPWRGWPALWACRGRTTTPRNRSRAWETQQSSKVRNNKFRSLIIWPTQFCGNEYQFGGLLDGIEVELPSGRWVKRRHSRFLRWRRWVLRRRWSSSKQAWQKRSHAAQVNAKSPIVDDAALLYNF